MRSHTVKLRGTTLEVELCEIGQLLHDEWTSRVESHAPSEEILIAMTDYFQHKNGLNDRFDKPFILPCKKCSSHYAKTEAKGKTGQESTPQSDLQESFPALFSLVTIE